jgi:pyridoxine 5-phosphate synthase
MKKLGINVDHVATIRNARGGIHPDPLAAAIVATKYGADSITIHLREDRRHIKDFDVKKICKNNKITVNLEMAANLQMLKIALKNKPNYVCIVPEKRKEVTTEGGLNILKNKFNLNKANIRTSLFINPSLKDIKLSKEINSECIEIHTGKISELIKANQDYSKELKKIKKCAKYAISLGLEVHAGHGMDYKTTKILNSIKEIKEFNIGHFIIGESFFYGIKNVIKKFKGILKK